MLNESFDDLESGLGRLEAADARNAAAILNAIDVARAEFEQRSDELDARLGRLSGSAGEPESGLQASADRILKLITELAAKEVTEGT